MPVCQGLHETQIHIDMRTSYYRADNAVDGGLDTIDRQCQPTREVVA